ncbi:MAG TPA: EAL domain-containing protein [Micavibrio sp.]|jgi:cyclic-di-GMP phosphodiesterase TipF (flagellum assembly factor)
MALFDILHLRRKKPKDESLAANKKGEGFRFHSPRPEDVFRLVKSRRGRLAILTAIGTGLIFMAVTRIDQDNAFLLLAITSVAILVIYDISSRRFWEKTVTEQMQTLGRNHDRLVREVARNRTDVAVIKEGLSDTAVAVQDIGRNHSPARSVEGRMIETIVEQLAVMGQKPRARIAENDAAPAVPEPDPMEGILQLEVSPPPRFSRVPSSLESELSPNFDKFSDTVILELIRHAVRHDHLDVFVQPIVSLPQRKLRMYEVFARLRASAGAYIPAARYLELARKEKLASAIDSLLLLHCLQILRDRRDDGEARTYALNITSGTLHDTGFMNDLVTFLARYRRLAARLIFELPLQDVENADKILIELLDGLSQLGCRFSVDQVRKRRIDINLLRGRHIRFLKLDAKWLLREAAQEGGQARVMKLKKQMDRSGLDLVVEKIEKESELRELLEYGIDYGQGYFFGKPDLHAVYRSRERRDAA